MSEVSNWAVVNNGVVEATIFWDGITEWNPCHEDDLLIDISDLPISPLWTYVDGVFSPSEPFVD
jgi:hypothetical protein